MRRLRAAGWESWLDAAAWAHANGVGTTAIAARLEAPVSTIEKRLKAAGVHVGRPDVSADNTKRMLAEVRELLPGDPQLRDGSKELRHWLDYCGYSVRGDVVWPKTRKSSDEIAMVLARQRPADGSPDQRPADHPPVPDHHPEPAQRRPAVPTRRARRMDACHKPDRRPELSLPRAGTPTS